MSSVILSLLFLIGLRIRSMQTLVLLVLYCFGISRNLGHLFRLQVVLFIYQLISLACVLILLAAGYYYYSTELLLLLYSTELLLLYLLLLATPTPTSCLLFLLLFSLLCTTKCCSCCSSLIFLFSANLKCLRWWLLAVLACPLLTEFFYST